MLSASTTIHMRAHELRDALHEGDEIARRDLAQLADDMIGWAETMAVLERDRKDRPASPLAGQARHYTPVFEAAPCRSARWTFFHGYMTGLGVFVLGAIMNHYLFS